jgi:hypothetical protein
MKILFKFFLVVSVAVGFCVEGLAQNITWQKFYRTKGLPSVTTIQDIVQTNDEGYIFIGTSQRDSAPGSVSFVYGIDKFGDSLWYREYLYAPANVIHRLLDGNYMIIDSYCTLIKINPTGDTLWTKSRSFTNYLLLGHRSVYYNNEFYIAGFNGYNNKPYILRLDSSGNDVFLKEFDYEWGRSNGILVNDDKIYLSGYSNLPSNYFLIKSDLTGNIIWIKDYNQTPLNFNGNAIIKLPHEESIILCGSSFITGSGIAAALMKRDTAGNIIWQQSYISSGSSATFFANIMNDISGGLISFGGTTQLKGNKALLIKTDYSGNEMWRKQYIANDNYETRCFKTTLDSGYIMGGLTTGEKPISIIKTDKLGNVVSVNNNNEILPSGITLYQNFPNPFNPSTTIRFELNRQERVELSVFDIKGKLIKKIISSKLNAGSYSVIFEPEINLSSGIYFYTLEVENFIITKKLTYLK